MADMLTNLLGGIGLFLLGMILMTDGLKALAGDALRRVLDHYVRGPLSALSSGAAVTIVVQSSSATTLTTIGFVSAGLLTLPQAIGVLFGANLGTTSTGWIVSLLGLKLSIGAVALPLVGFGALARLLTRDRVAAAGLALAGFGLIFVGIDTLRMGMQDLSAQVSLSAFEGDSAAGRLQLVAIGFAMTVIMQSSSAAVATTLTALDSGAVDLVQAAALVIGQNVGTTLTAGIACIGASTPARRAAVAHILFNLLTGLVAFVALAAFVRVAVALVGAFEPEPGALTLAAFHTLFNVLGVALLLPWIRGFARLVVRLVPERGPQLTRRLDPSVVALAPVAVEAAQKTLRDVTAVLAERIPALVRNHRALDEATAAPVQAALWEVRDFVGRIRADPETAAEHSRHLATLHALDHVERLVDTCGERVAGASDPDIDRGAAVFLDALEGALPWLRGESADPPDLRLGEASAALADLRREHRRRVLEETAISRLGPHEGMARLEFARWVDRLAYHVWRAVHHLAPVRESEKAELSAGP
jgi:phosphate:Na+ symporter